MMRFKPLLRLCEGADLFGDTIHTFAEPQERLGGQL